jgi:hypothetical protein
VLQVPDLRREPLQAAAEDRDGGQQRGVPIALDDLGARGVDRQAELAHDLDLDLGLEVAVRPHRTGELPGRNLVDRPRQAAAAAVDLERPARELQPERRRLGVHRVGPTHHQRVRLGAGARDEHLHQLIGVTQQQLAGGAELQGERRVDHVRRREAVVEEPALRPDRFDDLGDEGDDVVIGGPLELLDPRHVHRGPRLDRGEGVLRNPPAAGLRPTDGELDAEHVLEAGRICPDRAHLGQRVAPDHRAAPTTAGSGGSAAAMSWRRCMPSQEIRLAAFSAPYRAAARSAARPTTVSTRPPPVP